MSDFVLGLLGSGEFEPWAGVVDRELLERARVGEGRALVIPTACAPEGDEVWDRWATMGLRHYESLGVSAEVVELKTGADAEDPAIVGRLEGASLAFFSGGNPAYLSATLAGSPFWERLLDGMRHGLAYGGCSAGIACLGGQAPDNTVEDPTSPDFWKPGLGLFPDLHFGPHWDALEAYLPGLQRIVCDAVPEGHALLAVDERTAVVGDGTEWKVVGSGEAHYLKAGDWSTFGVGDSFRLPLLPGA